MALGLARSLSLSGDGSLRVVMTDLRHPDLGRWFDVVLPPRPGVSTYLQKLSALESTDADAVLFVDADSLAFGPLDPIWEYCQGKPLAVQGYVVRDGHWYGELARVLPRLGLPALPRFNGGMIYYERGEGTAKLIEAAREVAEHYEETGLELFRGQAPDEPCLSIAMARTGIGELIPDEKDFMNTPVGLVGKLRMDVTKGECSYIKRGVRMRLIRPVLLHAAKYVLNCCYWRELAKLERLDRYERRHGYGHMGFSHRLRRSIERRLLRLRGKI